MVGKEVESAGELGCELIDVVGEIYGFLVDDEFFKGEGHDVIPLKKS